MTQPDLHPDAFMDLLTDALRAGPGSPSWHEAVERLRARGGGGDADEHRLLMEARERLESGRGYRSVRAGPGFTRRLMDAIETDERSASERARRWGRWVPRSGAIAIASALLVVVALVALAYYLGSAPPQAPASPDIERLAGLYLIETIQANSFESPGTSEEPPVPTGWRVVGRLPVTFSHGLRVSGETTTATTTTPTSQPAASDPNSGGLVWERTLPAAEPFGVEAVLRVGRANENVVPQIVISGGSREFVFLVRDGRAAIVLPDGRVATQSPRLRELSQPMTVRVTVDRENAIVEVAGKRFWAGLHGLSTSASRSIGLRFLQRGAEKPDPVEFRSIKILTAPAR